jgi:hypothetical protein
MGTQGCVTKIERYSDWQERLKLFLTVNRQRPFRWGSWDCCLFACNAVREITGSDLALHYRGQYKTMLGAMRLINGSVDGVADKVASEFMIARYKTASEAEPGDIVLATITEMNTLGIVSLMRLAVFSTLQGLSDYPLSISKIAWRIG